MKPTRTARSIGQIPGASTRLFIRLADARQRRAELNLSARRPFLSRVVRFFRSALDL